MMKNIFLFVLFMSTMAFAAKEVGNGGDVVVCKSPTGQLTYELLDYYEARVMRGIEINLDSYLANDEKNLALAVLARLGKLNPIRQMYYAELVEEFYYSQQMLRGVKLVDVQDSQHVFLPEGCYIHQAIVQRNPKFSEDKRYLIDGDLWQKLDLVTRAGLILHEVIYRETLLAEHEDSTSARYFHSYLAANKFKEMDHPQYVTLLDSAGMPDYEYQGINLALCKPIEVNGERKLCGDRSIFPPFSASGHVMEALVVPRWAPWAKKNADGEVDQTIQWRNRKIKVIGWISWFNDQPEKIRSFYPHGIDEGLTDDGFYFKGPTMHDHKCYLNWSCHSEDSTNYQVTLGADGVIHNYVPNNYPEFVIAGQKIVCQYGHQVDFREDGKFNSCRLAGLTHFKGPFFEAWAKGIVVFEGDTLVSLSEIESGYIQVGKGETAQNISVTSFGTRLDSEWLNFTSERPWSGNLLDQLVTFGPGKFGMNQLSGRVHQFNLRQAQKFELNNISPQPLNLKLGSVGVSMDTVSLDFEGEALLKSIAGVWTMYLGPAKVLMNLSNENQMLVTDCKRWDGTYYTLPCPTYAADQTEAQ